MKVSTVKHAKQLYKSIDEKLDSNRRRKLSSPVAHDLLLLDKICDLIKKSELVLDLGCGAPAWITQLLQSEGAQVIGMDVYKEEWHNGVVDGINTIEYDGKRIPIRDNEVDLILLFGVLEHVGISNGNEKFKSANQEVWNARSDLLKEVHRVVNPTGSVYVTRFPNTWGREQLQPGGHLNSERATLSELKHFLSNYFTIEQAFGTGMIPYRRVLADLDPKFALKFARINDLISSAPILWRITQSFNFILSPSPLE